MTYGFEPESRPAYDLTQVVDPHPRWEGRTRSRMASNSEEVCPSPAPTIVASDKTTSSVKTVWNIANAVQGVSVMSLPYAVLRGGWVALGGFLVVALISNITGKVS